MSPPPAKRSRTGSPSAQSADNLGDVAERTRKDTTDQANAASQDGARSGNAVKSLLERMGLAVNTNTSSSMAADELEEGEVEPSTSSRSRWLNVHWKRPRSTSASLSSTSRESLGDSKGVDPFAEPEADPGPLLLERIYAIGAHKATRAVLGQPKPWVLARDNISDPFLTLQKVVNATLRREIKKTGLRRSRTFIDVMRKVATQRELAAATIDDLDVQALLKIALDSGWLTKEAHEVVNEFRNTYSHLNCVIRPEDHLVLFFAANLFQLVRAFDDDTLAEAINEFVATVSHSRQCYDSWRDPASLMSMILHVQDVQRAQLERQNKLIEMQSKLLEKLLARHEERSSGLGASQEPLAKRSPLQQRRVS